jgi:ABC-type polysaccharide/polyol phosphate transport system ATPase subunit
MGDIVIRAENLGKLYQLGETGTGTISHDLNRWWARMRGREDPFARIGETNDRTQKGESDYVWALKDVNLEIKQGEVLGIIGRNGAGKSTLLKILSKITTPTTGRIKVKGRIASLLEIGTGFHHELTGRENIFLNGAILGMHKAEIKSRFDEIVDFAGVEKYIDTPVKRYSSGMYVRLAFAVAAFLEPEILIVDEVLAVGDAEFQKKCLGRMKEVSVNDGRTVLFVSHNMGAVRTLCSKGLLLNNGTVSAYGSIRDLTDAYTQGLSAINSCTDLTNYSERRSGNKLITFKSARILNQAGDPANEFFIGEDMTFEVEIHNPGLLKTSTIGIQIKGTDDLPLMHILNHDSGYTITHHEFYEKFQVTINDLRLYPGAYLVTLTIADTGGYDVYDTIEGCIGFTILEGGAKAKRKLPKETGLFFLTPNWNKLQQVNEDRTTYI